MGRPKHLLEIDRETLVERGGRVIEPFAEEVVLLGCPKESNRDREGAGDTRSLRFTQSPPADCRGSGGTAPPSRRVITDVLEGGGPIGGMLSAHHHRPDAAWLIVACDLPLIRREAVAWLIDRRRPGRIAVLPRARGEIEPLFAIYEPEGLSALAEFVRQGVLAPRRLAECADVSTPDVPLDLAACWANVNTPREWVDLFSEPRP